MICVCQSPGVVYYILCGPESLTCIVSIFCHFILVVIKLSHDYDFVVHVAFVGQRNALEKKRCFIHPKS